jgi:hypothetical protein
MSAANTAIWQAGIEDRGTLARSQGGDFFDVLGRMKELSLN